MSFEEFIQTRGFGFTVMLVMYIGCLFMMYHTGKHVGFKQGASQVIRDKKQITQYVYPDGSIVYISEDEEYVVAVNINEGYIYRMPFKGTLDDEYYRLEGDRIVKVPRVKGKDENNDYLVGTNKIPAKPWEPEPGELVAVKDEEEDFWRPLIFIGIGTDGKYLCGWAVDTEADKAAAFDQCEPLYRHFNIPKRPEGA